MHPLAFLTSRSHPPSVSALPRTLRRPNAAAPWALALVLAALAVGSAQAQAQAGSRAVPTVQAGTPADNPLSERELATAALVHVGSKTCSHGRNVRIEADPRAAGHFVLQSGALRYQLRPVETSTGAIRLEDRAQGAVWIQLANKSMLLGQRPNRRLLDDCSNALQQAVAAAMLRNPGPDLLGIAQRPAGQ